jgi:pteridine reductase
MGESPLPLAGRAVLVTGGARRLGAALVRAVHGAGASLAVHYRKSADAAQALCAELNGLRPGSAVAIAADLNDLAALEALPHATTQAFGRLDVLVNNASTFYPTPMGSIGLEAWNDLVGSNLRAPLFLAQAARPSLRETKGLILNLIDIHGFRPLKQYPVYSIAKAGLVMLTQSLARELGPEIRVNGIAPGSILWPEAPLDPVVKARILDRTALKRAGSPEDIAKAALYFMTDAPYVTGQVLAVDGGRMVGGL